jgi:uncharacterized membrane protein YphA (DoxX/SURF4 family)
MTTRVVTGWVLSIVAALAFTFAGAIKLAGNVQAVTMFAQFGLPPWFVYLVGIAEIAGSVLLLVPWRPSIGAAILCCVAAGAAFECLAHEQAAFAPMAPVLAALAVAGTLLRGARASVRAAI